MLKYERGQYRKIDSHLLIFSKLISSKTSFRNTNNVPNSLHLDQPERFVQPDLGPNCLQRLSKDDKSSLQ